MKVQRKKVGKVTVTVLIPGKGKVLTPKNSEDKIYLHDPIWLGLNDSEDNWLEIDDPELSKKEE